MYHEIKKKKNTYTKEETQNCSRKKKLKKKLNLLLLCTISNMEFKFNMKTHTQKRPMIVQEKEK